MEGEDVYAAAREEYRKVIREQAEENKRLREELDRWLCCEEVIAMQGEIKRLRAAYQIAESALADAGMDDPLIAMRAALAQGGQ